MWLRSAKGALFDRTIEKWNHNRTRSVVDDVWRLYLESERRRRSSSSSSSSNNSSSSSSSEASNPTHSTAMSLSSFMYKYAHVHGIKDGDGSSSNSRNSRGNSNQSKHMINKKRIQWSINFVRRGVVVVVVVVAKVFQLFEMLPCSNNVVCCLCFVPFPILFPFFSIFSCMQFSTTVHGAMLYVLLPI